VARTFKLGYEQIKYSVITATALLQNQAFLSLIVGREQESFGNKVEKIINDEAC
jgi:hypothetical protein